MIQNGELRSDGTRDRILKTSALLFCQQGYAGVSMRKIAQSCDMKAGSLYYHFASKDQILADVLRIGIEKVHAAVAAALDTTPPDAPPRERLRRAISGHLGALLAYSSFTSANVRIFHQVPEPVQQGNLEVRRAYEALWDGVLRDMQGAGLLRAGVDLGGVRLMLIGALNATLDWFDPALGDVEELADRYCDVVAHGILAERQA